MKKVLKIFKVFVMIGIAMILFLLLTNIYI